MADRVPVEKVDIPCPKCKIGNVKLSGNVEWKEDTGKRLFQAFREYECENCGHKFKAHYITLHEGVSLNDVVLPEEFNRK